MYNQAYSLRHRLFQALVANQSQVVFLLTNQGQRWTGFQASMLFKGNQTVSTWLLWQLGNLCLNVIIN